ncbi:MAG: methyltransferase domain-containing protein [Acidimicrobiales bacterium]|nr:methyltransferase domain-containing protein [Acidimicrobiales bacterium]
MLTVEYDRLGVRAGDRLLDLGCGAGRHAFEAARRGARVVALDYDAAELKDVAALFEGMHETGEATGPTAAVNGDAGRLPFPDGAFDRVIAAEVLEHLPEDQRALAELARVLRPGGTMAVTVPSWLAERVCWALSDEYHAPFVAGGHVRIYTEPELRAKLETTGLQLVGAHRAHALHTAYWWLRCAVGPTDDDHPLVRAYHRVLVWDITDHPPLTRWTERALNPVLGKSLVLYARKPEQEPSRAIARA